MKNTRTPQSFVVYIFTLLLALTLTACGTVNGSPSTTGVKETVTPTLEQFSSPIDLSSPPVSEAEQVSESVVRECVLPVGETVEYGFLNYPGRVRALIPEGSTTDSLLHITLHGAGQNIETHAATTRFDDVTNLDGGITIYLEKDQNTPWLVAPKSVDINNVYAAISALHGQGCGSPQTTTISGYSMGAMLTSRLICDYPDMAKTIALVAGALPPREGCVIPSDMKIFIQHGLADPIVNFDGVISTGWVRQTTGADWQPIDSTGVNKTQTSLMWQQLKQCPYPNDVPTLTSTTTPVVVDLNTCSTSAPTQLVLHWGSTHGWETDNTYTGWTSERIRSLANT